MSTTDFLKESAQKDPTWNYAYDIVRKELKIPSHVHRLFKLGWTGQIDLKEYLKVLGFSRLNPACLLTAAEKNIDEAGGGGAAVEHAIMYLGTRLSAVVLAVNLVGRQILRSKPPAGWKTLFQDMMTDVEIGYKLGARSPDIGVEGGSLVGFAKHAGIGLLMSSQPTKWKLYQKSLREGNASQESEKSLFGCESYQIASFILQQLGFGIEVAIGTALGSGALQPEHVSFDREVLRWKATHLWIEALRSGRNFPAELEMRNFFPELVPGSGPERNLNLEVLYTEVAKVKQNKSEWTWHLPKAGYDETQEHLGL